MQRRLTFLDIGFVEVGTCEEIVVTLAEVLSQFVVHLATGLMAVERCRGGVCDGHRGGNAHGLAGLLGPGRDAADGCLQILQHADGAVLRLVSCGERRAAGSGVSDAVCGRVRVHHSHHRQAGHQDGLKADAPLQGSEIGLGDVDLVHTHSVADEVEHILDLPFSKG